MPKACKYIPRLETERLILRQLQPDDAEDLRKWLGRDEVYTYRLRWKIQGWETGYETYTEHGSDL